MIETSQLQTLVTVSRAKSFSKAAKELDVTQSAISQSIKNLENKLSVQLFKRDGKKVVLTQEGERLHKLASNFLDQLEDTLEEIKHQKNSMSGKIRIGTLTGVGKSWLINEAITLTKTYPDLSIELKMATEDVLVREFDAYQLDFLIMPEQSLPTRGEKVLLGEEVSTLVFPDSEEFPLNPFMDLETLTNYPAILFGREDHLFTQWCLKVFGRIPKKIKGRLMVNAHGAMLQAVQKGLGIAVVPKHVLSRSYYKEKVKTLGKEFEVNNGRFYLVYNKDSANLLRFQQVISHLSTADSPLG